MGASWSATADLRACSSCLIPRVRVGSTRGASRSAAEGEPLLRRKYVALTLLGGMGRVYRAHDRDLGRDVALKFLHERHRDKPGLVRRFLEEAQIGAQLQ